MDTHLLANRTAPGHHSFPSESVIRVTAVTVNLSVFGGILTEAKVSCSAGAMPGSPGEAGKGKAHHGPNRRRTRTAAVTDAVPDFPS